MNKEEIRKQLCYFLLLFSGLQMICILYYDWDVASGRSIYITKLGSKLYPVFKYGSLSLFLNGFLYHCISEPINDGHSGIPFEYIIIVINVNQLISVICFFYPLMKLNAKNGYVLFEIFIYIPTLIFGILLNIFGWEKKKPKFITIKGSCILSRRRDWGLVGVYMAASQIILIFWSSMKCFYDSELIKQRYGNYFTIYASSLFLMVIGSLGYHVLALKVSYGNCECHHPLKVITLFFAIIEFIGLIIYIVACSKANQTRIFYYHSLLFSIGLFVSAIGNTYLSWKKFDDDIYLIENLLSENNNNSNEINKNLVI